MASHTASEDNSWFTFDRLRNVGSTLINGAKTAETFIKDTANAAGNKWNESSTVIKACVIGTTIGVAAPLAIIPTLGAVGFTSAGIAAGSFAASMQTATTASGSLFALCQSAGATGAVARSTSIGVVVGTGVTAGGITAAVCRNNSNG